MSQKLVSIYTQSGFTVVYMSVTLDVERLRDSSSALSAGRMSGGGVSSVEAFRASFLLNLSTR